MAAFSIRADRNSFTDMFMFGLVKLEVVGVGGKIFHLFDEVHKFVSDTFAEHIWNDIDRMMK
jgi:hypothetical protein